MCTPQYICEKLGGLGFEEVIKAWKYVRHYTENLQRLQVKLRDLGDCTATITREVSEAIGRDDEIEGSVLHWQTDADSLKVNIEQLIGESTTKASISCIACSSPNILWRYKFSKQAEDKIANAVELIKNCNNFNHQISHPRSHYMENLQKLKDKLRDLGNCREIIRGKVSEANGRGDEIEVNVSHWQTDVDSLKADIERLISESTNLCSTECPDITWQHKFSKQAEDKIANAVELITNCSNFNHQISHPRPHPPELESLSDKNYVNFDSRASIFKDIMDALKDSNVNMIGVFGLGGVGKTTLVKELSEQMRKDGTFKQVAMAVVSKDLNVKEVQSRLADSLNFEFKTKADDQERRAAELWNKLANGDKYLIILDDIWERVKMEAIGIPCTNEKKGCKVVLTSRKENLLSTEMEVDRNFSIAILSSAEAWTLFMKKVGNSIQSQLEIKSLAYEVCERCKGLPVAINALGEALKGKQEHAWKTALNKLDKYMLKNIVDINPSVFASLKVSYDMLHPTDAKSCFLLCCLFAEDAEIPLDELTRFWFAGSFLAQKPCTLEEARNEVYTVVDALKSASLLSNGNDENVVKIHDVIRDVGISIAREEEAFLVDHGALRWPQNPQNGPSYSAISLIFKNVNEHPDGLVYPKLHTLTVVNSELSDLEFPDNFFNGMMQLTVLTISGIRMRRLPSSLAKLKNLRMLYLNRCELEDIAILKDLKSNLEVLSLRGSNIEALPSEIGQLTNLRVLDLQDCHKLKVIPRGVTSNLTSLEELYFPITFYQWGATIEDLQGTSSRENLSLEELRRSLSTDKLTTLHIHIPNVKLLPKEDLKFVDLKRFRITVGSIIYGTETLISRTCMRMFRLEGIQLRNEFIPLVYKAEVLVLKPESFVHPLQFNKFNKLTVLIIKHFKLKYLLSPTTARGLVYLEVLEVTSGEIMEGVVGFEEQQDENEITGEVKFSKLKELKLSSLPNLISFFAKKEEMGTTMGSFSARAQPLFNELVIFPVLEELTIDGLGSIIKIWDKQSVAVLEDQGSFCQLTNLEVKSCSKLMHVFPSNMHPLLKNLEELNVEECETMKGIAEFEGEIDEDGLRNEVAASLALEVEHLEMVGVPKITEIRDKQPLPEPKKEVEFLCKLMDIRIEKCDQLVYVFPSHMLPQNMQNLRIQKCDELEVIISKELKEKEAINNDIIVFPQLQKVTLWTLCKLKSFYTETQGSFFSHKVVFPVLKSMNFWNLDKITGIWDHQPLSESEKEAKSFSKLEDIIVHGCDQLEHVLPSYMLPQLKNLQELRIRNCTKVDLIISNNSKEKEATNNNDTIRFPQLNVVSLRWLPNLISFICSDEMQLFFSNKDAFPVLEILDLSNEFEFLRNETSTKEECGTSGKESDYNGEELDEDLETPTKENNKMAGTSPAQARKGKDIQEIPWERLNITREKYRQTRLEQYKNYENIPQSGERSEKDCNVTMKGGMYYEFKRNSRSVKSTILHRQLRNSVWATSKHDVYLMSHFSVTHWSALTCNKTEVLNVSGHVAPCEKHPGSLLEGFTRTQVSTLAVKDRLLVVGGFQGELICKNLDRPGVCFCTKTTYDDNAVTNAVEIYSTQSGAVHFTVANNDCGVRDFDMEQFQLSKHFSFPWPVNHTSMSPDGKLRIIVGDNPEGMLVDSGTGKMVAYLVGHSGFPFASAWHPDGLAFATGNEDKTCRIWDARNLSKSVAALKGNLGAIRSIRYSSDGRFMAMAEPADFIHVFDAKSGYEKEQEIDFFGEISGMSFSPDTESLFIGVCEDIRVRAAIGLWDGTYGGLVKFGGLLEFGRRRNNSCPDSIF